MREINKFEVPNLIIQGELAPTNDPELYVIIREDCFKSDHKVGEVYVSTCREPRLFLLSCQS